MDLTFQTGEGRFNLRTCGVILREGAVLVMRDDRSPYYYLSGGRVPCTKRHSGRCCGSCGRSWGSRRSFGGPSG